jgi:hypothetical protein
MTDQPPVQPPYQPPGEPGPGYPATQPMAAATGDPAAARGAAATGDPVPTSPAAAGGPAAQQAGPPTNVWHQATSTRGGRWAIALAAAALAMLMVLGVGVAGLLVLRNHDRFGMMGQRGEGFSRGQMGHGDGRNDGGDRGTNPLQPGVPGAPGQRGGGTQGLGGLGGLLGGGALHGTVTATVNGSPQALVFQRGQVSAVSATSITLKSSDGFVGTYGRTSATSSMMQSPVAGGQAFVLARASDKVAITIMSTTANGGVGPSN